MASFFRNRIANKILPFIASDGITPNIVSTFVKINKYKSKESQLFLPWKKLTNLCPENLISPETLVKNLRNQGIPTAEGIIDITLSNSPVQIIFTIDKHVYSKIILADICNNDNLLANSCLFEHFPKKKIVVECPSPGISKIFNMDHFRTALHANFVANTLTLAGHNVKQVTQVEESGLFAASLLKGCERFSNKEDLDRYPNYHLWQVYNAANSQYNNDKQFEAEVQNCLNDLMNGNESLLSRWQYLKNISLEDHARVYKQMGLSFDNILFDFAHSSEIKRIQDILVEKKLIVFNEDGSTTVNVLDDSSNDIYANESIAFALSRFVFGIINSKENHSFDEYCYVAPTSEKTFFKMVSTLCEKSEFQCIENLRFVQLQNITQFKNKKMKTVPVQDILHQTKMCLLSKLQTNLQLGIDSELESMADSLAYANICIHDLKNKRNIDYDFNRKDILSLSRTSGAALQLFHAGLQGLLEKDSKFELNIEADTSALLEQEAHDLVHHLSRFDEVISKAYLSLQPSAVSEYLFTLRHLTHRATPIIKLDKKHVKKTVLEARLLLLFAALKTLKSSLHLLNIEPYVNLYTPHHL